MGFMGQIAISRYFHALGVVRSNSPTAFKFGLQLKLEERPPSGEHIKGLVLDIAI